MERRSVWWAARGPDVRIRRRDVGPGEAPTSTAPTATPRGPDPQALDALRAAADRMAKGWLEDLVDLCRFRSRREEPEGMFRTADWIEARLGRLGATVDRVELDGAYPYLLGELAADRPDAPVLLNFNHYDVEVEPPGPDEAWTTPPFEPTVREGRLYARGVADDKAALLSRIHAVELLEAAGLGRPTRVRFLVEGKRTLGRPVLGDLIDSRPDWVECDGALWENSWTDLGGAPVLKFGEKGLILLSLGLRRLERDLSSQNAVLLPQAAAELAAAVAALTGTVDGAHVPGLLDPVRPWSAPEVEGASRLTYDTDYLVARAGGANRDRIESVPDPALAVRSRPTIVLTAFHAGPPPGNAALGLPAEATATLELRLVADQTTEGVLTAVRRFLDARGLADVTIDVLRRGEPERTATADPFGEVVIGTARDVYGHEPVAEPCSIWIGTRALVAARGTPIVGVGIGRPDASIDGPDEHVRLDDYRLGVLHVAAVMLGMGGMR